MFLWCPLWMVISQYFSIRPAWLAVPSTLVSWIGCSRASVWIPSRFVVRWSMKLSIAPLSNRAVSTVDRSAHIVKGTFIFCTLWYMRFGLFALPQVVEVEQFKNPPARRMLRSGLYPVRRRLALSAAFRCCFLSFPSFGDLASPRFFLIVYRLFSSLAAACH